MHPWPVKKILVIRLSALGDVIQTFPAFQAIRHHHPEAHITVLTTAPFKELLTHSRLFDDVWVHQRLKFHQLNSLLAFRRQLLDAQFERVYDLQLSQRTSFYYYLMGGPLSGVQWVGRSPGAAVRFLEPKGFEINTLDRHQALLAVFGMRLQKPDLRYLATPLATPIPTPYVVLVPGASSTFNGAKKWPQHHYAALCQALSGRGLTPVIVGGPGEDNSLIQQSCPQALDLTGQTSLTDIIALAKDACLVVGNDTGPMHLAAASVAKVLILFSGKTNAAKAVAPDSKIHWLQSEDIADLSPVTVIAQIDTILKQKS